MFALTPKYLPYLFQAVLPPWLRPRREITAAARPTSDRDRTCRGLWGPVGRYRPARSGHLGCEDEPLPRLDSGWVGACPRAGHRGTVATRYPCPRGCAPGRRLAAERSVTVTLGDVRLCRHEARCV